VVAREHRSIEEAARRAAAGQHSPRKMAAMASPLYSACADSRADDARLCLDRGADVDGGTADWERDGSNRTRSTLRARPVIDVAAVLLDHGADMYTRGRADTLPVGPLFAMCFKRTTTPAIQR